MNLTYSAPITIEFKGKKSKWGGIDVWKGEILGAEAVMSFSKPVTNASYKLEIPKICNRNASGAYFAGCQFKITGSGTNSFLHINTTLQDKCIMVIDPAKWDVIFLELIKRRIETNHVSHLKVNCTP